MNLIQHLKDRNMDTDITTFYVGPDTVTFPLFDFSNTMVGFQQYRPSGTKSVRRDFKSGKYFTHLVKGSPGVFGLDVIPIQDFNYIVLCEGIFKACRFHKYGVPAIATLSNDPKNLKEQLLLLSKTKTLIAVPDPDKAGKKLLNYGDVGILVCKPIDDMTEQEFEKIIINIKEYV